MAILIKTRKKYKEVYSGRGGIYVGRTQSGSTQKGRRILTISNKKIIKYVKAANQWCLTWFDKGIQRQEWFSTELLAKKQ